MKFSIVIPVYNVAPYLRDCLDSVIAQTHGDWEAICVDDGATDDSGRILDEFASCDARIKVVHQNNAGVSAARNAGLEKITGDWFLFLDGDDAIVPDALDSFDKYLVGRNCDAVLFHPYKDMHSWDRPVSSAAVRELVAHARPIELLSGKYTACGFPFNRLYRRDKFQQVRFPVGMKLYEDMWYWGNALCVDARWSVAEKFYYRYRVRSNSASSGVSKSSYRDLISGPVHMLEIMRKNLKASDSEASAFARKYLSRDGVFFGAMSWWNEYSDDDRHFILDKIAECRSYLPYEPFGFWVKACLMTVSLHMATFGIPAVSFAHRCVLAVNRRLRRKR